MECKRPAVKFLTFSLLAVVFAVGLTFTSYAAKTAPCAAFWLTAEPSAVPAGGIVTLTGSVTNCSAANERLTIYYVITGPCNYNDTYSVGLTLQPGATQTASVSRVVPTCSGNYTVTGAVYSGKTFLTSASTTFAVQ